MLPWLTLMTILEGAGPLVGFAVIQGGAAMIVEPPSRKTVKVVSSVPSAMTLMVWEPGESPPAAAVKARLSGETCNNGAALTTLIWNVFVTDAWVLSVTAASNVQVPVAVGVPL